MPKPELHIIWHAGPKQGMSSVKTIVGRWGRQKKWGKKIFEKVKPVKKTGQVKRHVMGNKKRKEQKIQIKKKGPLEKKRRPLKTLSK